MTGDNCKTGRTDCDEAVYTTCECGREVCVYHWRRNVCEDCDEYTGPDDGDAWSGGFAENH